MIKYSPYDLKVKVFFCFSSRMKQSPFQRIMKETGGEKKKKQYKEMTCVANYFPSESQ